MLPAAFASYSPSLTDPPGSSVLVAAVSWLEAIMLGSVATVIAVLAVASIGLMMFSGRINVRYGATVIIGCFILFGASAIATGIRAFDGATLNADSYVYTPSPPPPPTTTPPPANPDPYAGAALPAR